MTDARRRTLRTAVQLILGLLAALPLLVESGDLPSTLPGLGVALTVSTVVTRLMAMPGVERWLPEWMRAAADPDADAHRQAVRE